MIMKECQVMSNPKEMEQESDWIELIVKKIFSDKSQGHNNYNHTIIKIMQEFVYKLKDNNFFN